MNLSEFLIARIRDDEADAMAGWRWKTLPAGEYARLQARVLAECEAKRRIVEHAEVVSGMDYQIEGEWGTRGTVPWNEDEGIKLLRYLALPYADHPDYDQSWRP